jgi:hypothetical protein
MCEASKEFPRLQLEHANIGGVDAPADVGPGFSTPLGDLADIANLGLNLAETKRLLAGLQQEIVAAQVRDHAVRRPACFRCGGTSPKATVPMQSYLLRRTIDDIRSRIREIAGKC